MIEKHFGFTTRPFGASPQADRYFPADSIEHARQALARAIERAEGPTLVVGPSGTGKSLLCQVLAKQFTDRFRIANLSSARLCTRRALLQNILFELGLPYRDMEEGELRLSLMDHLEPGGACPRGLLLIVDEAHTLPVRLLEELRLLTNLIHEGQPRVRMLLAGSSALEEHFAHPKLDSFNQRLAARCYLHPMSREETTAYIRWQINSAGGKADKLVSEDALRAAFAASDGIPRLVNQVFDHALFLAAAGGKRRLDGEGIQEAWADLQQLPTPWNTAPPSQDAAREDIIEFGELDDDATSMMIADAASQPIVEKVTKQPSPAASLRIASPLANEPRPASKPDVHLYSPPTTKPEVELVFNQPADPFGDGFEDEEVVADHYAALQAKQSAFGASKPLGESLPPMSRLTPVVVPAESGTGSNNDASIIEPATETSWPDLDQSWVDVPYVAQSAIADLTWSESLLAESTEESTEAFTADAELVDDNILEMTSKIADLDSPGDEPVDANDLENSDVAVQIHRLRAVAHSVSSGGSSLAPLDRHATRRDDRDLLVIAERRATAQRLDQAIEQAGKQAYRQLFAKLRNG